MSCSRYDLWILLTASPVVALGSYVYSKKTVTAQRVKVMTEERARLLAAERAANDPRTDPVGSPSQEASSDPAPTRHAPADELDRLFGKSKYEATTPYKSTRGDRFS